MNKLIKWGAIVFIAWWAITAPAAAGHEVHHLAGFAAHAASALATAISSV